MINIYFCSTVTDLTNSIVVNNKEKSVDKGYIIYS